MNRAIAFIDGQNLYYAVREAFGYTYPNYDAKRLAERICSEQGWKLEEVRFYTGIPEESANPFWYQFWSKKFLAMSRQGVQTFSRPLRYRNKRVKLPDGKEYTFLVGEEKGIDVRIALDIVRMAHLKHYDVAVVFSQDQDMSEVADEIRTIAREQNRWIKIACAFPVSPTYGNRRGINHTDWIRIDRATYSACIDQRDYRPKSAQGSAI